VIIDAFLAQLDVILGKLNGAAVPSGGTVSGSVGVLFDAADTG
jgi:hypothetical protein